MLHKSPTRNQEQLSRHSTRPVCLLLAYLRAASDNNAFAAAATSAGAVPGCGC
jgi:hypothetical protein